MEYRKVVEWGVSRFEVYPVGGGGATITMGGMCGCCDAVNIVSGEALFTVDCRIIPEESIAGAEKEILGVVEGFRKSSPRRSSRSIIWLG